MQDTKLMCVIVFVQFFVLVCNIAIVNLADERVSMHTYTYTHTAD